MHFNFWCTWRANPASDAWPNWFESMGTTRARTATIWNRSMNSMKHQPRYRGEALDRLAAELEAGKSETLRNYLTAMGRFHRYSWGNVLLISSQRPDATHVE